MENLKILIVDDEELIRNGIARKVERMVPHAEIVGKAEDAEQAIELVKQAHPDIIISDIRMPEVDGFEFIQKVKNIFGDMKFILISGYDDFEYARKAIRLNVSEYLLKPVNNNELKSIIDKMEKAIRDERNQKEYIEDLKTKNYNNMYSLKNKYLTDAVNYSGDFDVNHILNSLEHIDVHFPHPCFSVVSILPGNLDRLPAFPEKEDIPIVKFAITNITEELLSSYGHVVAFDNLKKENHITAIINHTDTDIEKLSRLCRNLVDSLNSHLGLSVSVGIGKCYDHIRYLAVSCMESYTAALQKVSVGENKVILIDDVPASINFLLAENDKQLLLSYLNSNDMEKTLDVIDKVFAKAQAAELSYASIKTLFIDIAIMLGRSIKENGGNWNQIFHEDIFTEHYISHFTTIAELSQWLKDCVASICSYLSDLRKSDGKQAIKEIKEYIETYYYIDINLNDLARKYFMNPSYLSQLFKAETGEKFIDFVIRVRLEKAKELLSTTTLKTYEIAEMVGYSDARYFSDVFSKCMGLTPTKFREIAPN